MDGCAVQPISQSQFTPLPEALCWVIWELNLAERSTALDDVTAALGKTIFTPHYTFPLPLSLFLIAKIRILTHTVEERAIIAVFRAKNKIIQTDLKKKKINFFIREKKKKNHKGRFVSLLILFFFIFQVMPSRIWYRPATKLSTTHWANSSAIEK